MKLSEYPTPVTDAKRMAVSGSATALIDMTDHARDLERKLRMCREFINEICDIEGRFPYLNGTGVVSAAYTTLENTK